MMALFTRRLWVMLFVLLSLCLGLGGAFLMMSEFGQKILLEIGTWGNAEATERYQQRKAALGERLFFEKRLSRDGLVSCASCHDPSKAFSDGKKVSVGVAGKLGTRNAPSLLNVGNQSSFFWDGRRKTLREQVLDPLTNPVEHGLTTIDEAVNILSADQSYRLAFVEVFGAKGVRSIVLADALATYVERLQSPDSKIDRTLTRLIEKPDSTQHELLVKDGLSAQALFGLDVFRKKGQCVSCHTLNFTKLPNGPARFLLTDQQFHASGVSQAELQKHLANDVRLVQNKKSPLDHQVLNNSRLSQLGRFLVTLDPRDIGAFKTPSLRNVAKTAPYFHDGSVPTLEEAVEHELYYRSVTSGTIVLLPEEKQALVAFLKELDD